MSRTPIEALKLFNEKAALLRESNLVKFFHEQKRISVHLAVHSGKESTIDMTDPDPEAIDSVILNLRFFVQPKDGCTFKQLMDIYSKLEISEELKERSINSYNAWKKFLASKISITIDNHTPSHNEIFKTFLYGRYAHADPEPRRIYKEWEGRKYLFPFYKLEFIIILAHILGIINYFSKINEEVIARARNL